MENNKKSVKFEEPSDNKDDNNGTEPPPSAWKHRVNEITRIQLGSSFLFYFFFVITLFFIYFHKTNSKIIIDNLFHKITIRNK